MGGQSENTTNRVYIASKEFGWLPASIIQSDTSDTSSSSIVKVSVKDYEDDTLIPACEVSASSSSSSSITAEQRKRGITNIPSKEVTIDLSSKLYQSLKLTSLPLQNVNQEGQLIEVEDMVDLSFLHEAAILYNLKARHGRGIPYTRTGDIVIAVNPYQWITELYSEERRIDYAEKLVWNGEFYMIMLCLFVYDTLI